MQNRVITTLTYLASLLNTGDDEVLISLKGNKATMTTMNDLTKVEHLDLGSNPIQNIVSAVTEYMCTDCIEVDYLYRDDFFLALVKSYIETLVHEFGNQIPITYALARAILKFDLCPYKVEFLTRNDYLKGQWFEWDPMRHEYYKDYDFRLIV